jgi:hypothetical protein
VRERWKCSFASRGSFRADRRCGAARNFATYANQAGTYDELLAYLKKRR